jgi:hypothetical protein
MSERKRISSFQWGCMFMFLGVLTLVLLVVFWPLGLLMAVIDVLVVIGAIASLFNRKS